MRYSDRSRGNRFGIEWIVVLAIAAAFGGCASGASTPNDEGSGPGTTTTTPHTTSSSGSSSGTNVGSTSGTSSSTGSNSSSGGDTATSSSSGGSSTGGDDASSEGGDDGPTGSGDDGPATPSDDGSTTTTTPEAGASSDDGPSIVTDAPGTAACVKGQVPPTQVAMIGDSYLDYPAWSDVAPDLFTDARNAGSLGANVTYREYQLGGAAMNYGALNLNIPYQYETTAKGDLSVMDPTDIDTIIMDGGGNDVIIDNTECLTASGPPSGTDQCSVAIAGTLNRAQMLLQEMASDGVKHIVYFFYPHLDPAGGGLLPTPAPEVNATLDYAYPKAEEICCGTSFTSSLTNYSCTGNVAGTQCTFIDTRPSFEGHIADYIKSDNVHPTPAGAQVIADLIWNSMVANCIAQ